MPSSSVVAFSSNERLILTSWFEGVDCDETFERPEVERALAARGYTEPVNFIYTRHQAAVAAIVLDRHPHGLLFQADARRVVSEAIRQRRKPATAEAGDGSAAARQLFTIWWSGGPGGAWGNLYSLTWLPEFQRFVVTDSTDDDEPYQHTDFAIGHFRPCADESAAAMGVIAGHWRLRRDVSLDSEATVISVEPGMLAESVVREALEAVWTLVEQDDIEDQDEDEDDEPADDEEEDA